MPSLARQAGWALCVPIAAVLAYMLVAMVLLALGIAPVVATILTGVLTIASVIWVRSRRPDVLALPQSSSRDRDQPMHWQVSVLVILALIIGFLAGQTAGIWLMEAIGSPGFERAAQARTEVGIAVALLLSLLVSPMAEEALMRAVVYPLLRRRICVFVSAAVTTLGFAVLHANLVQALVIAPMSLVLCWLYERTASLWLCIIAHVAFNLAAALVPAAAVAELTSPMTMACLMIVFAVTLYATIDRDRALSDRSEARHD